MPCALIWLFLGAYLIYWLMQREPGVDPPEQIDSHSRVPKLATCEACNLEYVYFINVAHKPFTLPEKRACAELVQGAESANPSHRILKFMKAACALVPCPKCGHYQRQMVRLARSNQRRWMIKLALVLVVLSILLFLGAQITTARHNDSPDEASYAPMVVFWVLASVSATLGFLLPTVRYLLALKYDPNFEPQIAELSIQRTRALSKEEYLQRVEELRQELEQRKKRAR